MCTLTYIPLKHGRVITANRDESPKRNAGVLSPYYSAASHQFFIAEEPLRGGTNIAIGKDNRFSVLLNGAFVPHDMNREYGMSRGILLLKSLDSKNAFEFAEAFPFSKEDIQPFTLVDIADSIRELRWDGEKVYKSEFSIHAPGIWASAQLYSAKSIENRKRWFADLLAKSNIDEKKILDFHFNAGNGDAENDLVMNRGNLVQTVSITQMSEVNNQKELRHFDLVGGTDAHYKFA